MYATIDYIGKQRWGSVKYQSWSDEKNEDFNIPFNYMSWNQLNEAVESGMEIVAHTICHRNLTDFQNKSRKKRFSTQRKSWKKH